MEKFLFSICPESHLKRRGFLLYSSQPLGGNRDALVYIWKALTSSVSLSVVCLHTATLLLNSAFHVCCAALRDTKVTLFNYHNKSCLCHTFSRSGGPAGRAAAWILVFWDAVQWLTVFWQCWVTVLWLWNWHACEQCQWTGVSLHAHHTSKSTVLYS